MAGLKDQIVFACPLFLVFVASLLLVAMPGAPSSFLLLLVRHLLLVAMHLFLVASLLLVAMPFVPSSVRSLRGRLGGRCETSGRQLDWSAGDPGRLVTNTPNSLQPKSNILQPSSDGLTNLDFLTNLLGMAEDVCHGLSAVLRKLRPIGGELPTQQPCQAWPKVLLPTTSTTSHTTCY